MDADAGDKAQDAAAFHTIDITAAPSTVESSPPSKRDVQLQTDRSTGNRSIWRSLRFYIMLLSLITPLVTAYSKNVINIALTDMIDPGYNEDKPAQTLVACDAFTSAMTTTTTQRPPFYYFDHDDSCEVDAQTRERLIMKTDRDKQRQHSRPGEMFQWNMKVQGLLKAAFPIGHAILMIAGSRLSEIYGARSVISLSMCTIGVLCLMAPLAAKIGYLFLFADLMLLGVVSSFLSPSLYTLTANWLTPNERTIMVSCILLAGRLGAALSSLLCGLLFKAEIPWPYGFYTAGWFGFIASGVFALCARSRPQDHPLIGADEIDYLTSKSALIRENIERDKLAAREARTKPPCAIEYAHGSKGRETAPKRSAPWATILTSAPFWAFALTKFCVKLVGDTLSAELPTYLNRVMHMPTDKIGYIHSATFVIFGLTCLPVGTTARWFVKRRPFNLSKTNIRKLYQCTASYGVAVCMWGLAQSECNELFTLIFIAANSVLTTLSIGGEAQIPMDTTEHYTGTLHAAASTIGALSAIEPTVVGYFIDGHDASRHKWSGVWKVMSFVAMSGGTVFLIFGNAERQPWDSNASQPVAPRVSIEMGTAQNGNTNPAFEGDAGTGAAQPKHTVKVAPGDEQVDNDKQREFRESRMI